MHIGCGTRPEVQPDAPRAWPLRANRVERPVRIDRVWSDPWPGERVSWAGDLRATPPCPDRGYQDAPILGWAERPLHHQWRWTERSMMWQLRLAGCRPSTSFGPPVKWPAARRSPAGLRPRAPGHPSALARTAASVLRPSMAAYEKVGGVPHAECHAANQPGVTPQLQSDRDGRVRGAPRPSLCDAVAGKAEYEVVFWPI
jgi:hypothetical protein